MLIGKKLPKLTSSRCSDRETTACNTGPRRMLKNGRLVRRCRFTLSNHSKNSTLKLVQGFRRSSESQSKEHEVHTGNLLVISIIRHISLRSSAESKRRTTLPTATNYQTTSEPVVAKAYSSKQAADWVRAASVHGWGRAASARNALTKRIGRTK